MAPPRHLNHAGSSSSSPPMRNFGREDPPMTKEEYMQLIRTFTDARCARIRNASCHWYASNACALERAEQEEEARSRSGDREEAEGDGSCSV